MPSPFNKDGEPVMTHSQWMQECAIDAQPDGWSDYDDGPEDYRSVCTGCGLLGEHEDCIDKPENHEILWFCPSCWFDLDPEEDE